MQIKANILRAKQAFLSASRPLQLAVGAGALIVVITIGALLGGSDNSASGPTFAARQGQLDIIVREGGNVEALQSQQIRSAIRGGSGVKILSIVEEGYRVTAEDVRAGKILVELDSAQLNEQKLNQEIAYETADATYIERKSQLEIRINQNVANLNTATQRMRFARLDLEKFLGANVVAELTSKLGIEERLARTEAARVAATQSDAIRETRVDQIQQNRQQARRQGDRPAPGGFNPTDFDPSDLSTLPPQFRERVEQMMAQNGGEIPAEFLARMQGGGGGRPQQNAPALSEPSSSEPAMLALEGADAVPMPEPTSMLMDDEYLAIRSTIDFRIYADENRLEDGEAKQRLRTLQESVRVAEENYLQAQARFEGQQRLAARDFITPNDLEAEQSRLLQAESRLEQTITDLNLYTQYTFIKDADQQLANYEDAIMSYQRTQAEAAAELAQAEARYKSAAQRLNLEAGRLADINEQLAQTVIRAQRPGLVVYGSADSSGNPFRGNNQEPIQEGATVRERQAILTIPDMTEMSVRANIHESAVQRVREGQQVAVRIDAFPNTRLTGEVIKVAVVADSGNAFMNPDLKVYPTIVRIDGEHDWLRPGMSAEVEILVDSLDNVVYIPIQAVAFQDGEQVVYVARGGRREMRRVETGNYSEQFIEIVSGLRSGEEVMLLPPRQGAQVANL
jgi:multidrug resistance efflux pump